MNSEAIVLSLILRDEDVWYLAGITKDMLIDHRAVRIYEAMAASIKKDGYISRESVAAKLNDRSLIEWLDKESDQDMYRSPSWEFHRERIVREYKKKSIRNLLIDAQEQIDKDVDPDVLSEQIMSDAKSIRLDQAQDASQSYGERVRSVLDMLSGLRDIEGLPGVSCGLRAIDGAMGGFQRRRLYYVAARPSQGKSALLGQFADNALKEGRTVGYISLESAAHEIILRSWSRTHRIPMKSIQSGMISGSQYHSLQREIDNTDNKNLWIDDTPNADIHHITRQAQLWKARYDIDILFIDYVQLIRVPSAADRRETVEEASRSLKDLSRHLDIPVVAAAQLRRDVDGRQPHLGDFQHSSALEQDADVAMLIHWESNFSNLTPVDIILAKNRDGEKAKVSCLFEGSFVNFREEVEDNVV